jgi:hypothetical protein
MNDLGSMTPTERAGHYRQMAQEAMLRAQSATYDRARKSFMELAAGWHALALQFEETALERELSIKDRGRGR